MTTNEELKMRWGEWRMNEMNQNTKTNNEHLFSDIPFHSVRRHSVPIWRMERIIYHREVDRGILSIMLFKKERNDILLRFLQWTISVCSWTYKLPMILIILYICIINYCDIKKNHDDSSPAVLRIVYLGVVIRAVVLCYTLLIPEIQLLFDSFLYLIYSLW